MAVDQNQAVSGTTAPSTPKVRPLARSRASLPVKSSLGGWSQIAAAFDRARASAAQQSGNEKSLIASINATNDATGKKIAALQGDYDGEMQRINAAAQRQRLIGIKQAQALRKALPIIGVFALIAGASDGVLGAMSALAGGLAGLSQGQTEAYKRAWNEYDAQVKGMFAEQKGILQEMKDVRDDASKTVDQKIALFKVIGSGNKLFSTLSGQEANSMERWMQNQAAMANRIKVAEIAHAKAAAQNAPADNSELSETAVELSKLKRLSGGSQ